MKVGLLEIRETGGVPGNKDTTGGLGSGIRIGNSIRAKIIENLKKGGVKLPLLSLAYIAAILKKNGHEVKYYRDTIPAGCDLVVMAASLIDYRHEMAFAKKVRQAYEKKGKKVQICFYGPFASVFPDKFLEVADTVIVGEAEAAFMEHKKSLPRGKIEVERVEDIDSIPFPLWDIFPINSFGYSPVIREKPFLTMLASRGCSFPCIHYCAYAQFQGGKIRMRSIDNIIDEMKYLKKKFKVKGILFRDPMFSFDKKRIVDLAQAMINNKIDVKWACETRLDFLDRKMIDVMHKSGLRAINVGIESADEEVLRKASRIPIQIKHQEDIIKYCKKKHIHISAFYILGFPDDTEESIRKTVEYAKRLNTHIAQFTISTPLPGTGFFDEKKKDFTTRDLQKFDSTRLVFKHKNLENKQLQLLRERAFVEYYFRPKYMAHYIKDLLVHFFER